MTFLIPPPAVTAEKILSRTTAVAPPTLPGVSGECLLWQGATIRGYGAIKVGGRHGPVLYTHRVVWEAARGPIPEGLTIDHLCVRPLCQNHQHMEVVTRAENARRQKLRATHCSRGHPLTPDNIVQRKAFPTHRDCKTCHRERQRRYKAEGRRRAGRE